MKKFLFLSIFFVLNSQELPPIATFNQTIYSGGIQNWMLSQSPEGFIYVANNEGLLEYNGSSWQMFPSPNNSIMRSVLCVDDVIYTGCYMEFGYWKKNQYGQLVYHSINQKTSIKLTEDEQFWGIFDFNQWIIFQSLQNLYLYDKKTSKVRKIKSETPIFKAYTNGNQFLFQNSNGLNEIENFSAKNILDNTNLLDNKIISVFRHQDKDLIVTQSDGIYYYEENKLYKLNTQIDDLLKSDVIYSAIKLKNNSIALGTISNGLIVLSPEESILFHVTQSNGLNNNTVLALMEDNEQNLWLGLDNGINVINKNSNILNYSNLTGLLGTVYVAKSYQDNLYIGTNQGLFYKPINKNIEFELVKGTKGQVWELFVHDNTLFCGHDKGTFIINNNQSKLIFEEQGTWKFQVDNQYIYQGNYYGLSILKKVDGSWVFDKKVDEFNFSCRYFEIIDNNHVIVNHEYRGLYLLTIDKLNKKVKEFKLLKSPIKGKNSGLIKHHNKIYYASPDGVFVYNTKKQNFDKHAQMSEIFDNNQFVSGRMISSNDGNLWLFTKDYLVYFSLNKISNELTYSKLPISSNIISTMHGYENIYNISKDNYLIGTTNGYYLLNTDKPFKNNFKINLNKVQVKRINEPYQYINISGNEVLEYYHNNISFDLSVLNFNSYINTEYQYKLDGLHDQWSEWSLNSDISFENLKPGKYTLRAKAKVSSQESENIISYSFEIKKPWYYSHLALLFYIILGVFLAYYVHKRYQKYYHEKHQKIIAENNLLLELKELENQQEIMKIKNEQLTKDVDQKNKELAVSTMSLLKKDELLRIIKEDLKNTTDTTSNKRIKSVINVINRNVKEDGQWDIFREAFDKADNDFIKKMKEAHPNLTPNDLRLCAYLRLNLSSKEIAPLLNISVRSVEIKRYRLRKKMNLEHEKSLVEYILEV